MEDRIVTVTIDPKGQKMAIDMDGFHGVGCRAIGDAFASIGPLVSEVEKPEIYENANQNVLTTGL